MRQIWLYSGMKFDYIPVPGEMFVDLSCSYCEAKIIQAYINKEDNNRLYGTYRDDETAVFVKKAH